MPSFSAFTLVIILLAVVTAPILVAVLVPVGLKLDSTSSSIQERVSLLVDTTENVTTIGSDRVLELGESILAIAFSRAANRWDDSISQKEATLKVMQNCMATYPYAVTYDAFLEVAARCMSFLQNSFTVPADRIPAVSISGMAADLVLYESEGYDVFGTISKTLRSAAWVVSYGTGPDVKNVFGFASYFSILVLSTFPRNQSLYYGPSFDPAVVNTAADLHPVTGWVEANLSSATNFSTSGKWPDMNSYLFRHDDHFTNGWQAGFRGTIAGLTQSTRHRPQGRRFRSGSFLMGTPTIFGSLRLAPITGLFSRAGSEVNKTAFQTAYTQAPVAQVPPIRVLDLHNGSFLRNHTSFDYEVTLNYLHSQLDLSAAQVVSTLKSNGLSGAAVGMFRGSYMYACSIGHSASFPNASIIVPALASCNPLLRAFAYKIAAEVTSQTTVTEAEFLNAAHNHGWQIDEELVRPSVGDPRASTLFQFNKPWSHVVAGYHGTSFRIEPAFITRAISEIRADLLAYPALKAIIAMQNGAVINEDTVAASPELKAAITKNPCAAQAWKFDNINDEFKILADSAEFERGIADIETELTDSVGGYVGYFSSDLNIPGNEDEIASHISQGVDPTFANLSMLLVVPRSSLLGANFTAYSRNLNDSLALGLSVVSDVRRELQDFGQITSIFLVTLPMLLVIICASFTYVIMRAFTQSADRIRTAAEFIITTPDGEINLLDSANRTSALMTRLNGYLRSNNSSSSLISEVSQVWEAERSINLSLDTFSRYLPTDVCQSVLEGNLIPELGFHDNPDIVVMFADIADFTGQCERHAKNPQKLSLALEQYFTLATQLCLHHRGSVDKFIGDCIMAVWNFVTEKKLDRPTNALPLHKGHSSGRIVSVSPAVEKKLIPTPRDNAEPEHCINACRVALGIQQITWKLQSNWSKLLPGEELRVRVGINQGAALVGHIGAPGRMNYTALGDTVNVASRLEAVNKMFRTSICVSDRVLDSAVVQSFVNSRLLGVIRVAGRQKLFKCYEILSVSEVVGDELSDVASVSVSIAKGVLTMIDVEGGLNLPPTPPILPKSARRGSFVSHHSRRSNSTLGVIAPVACSQDPQKIALSHDEDHLKMFTEATEAYINANFTRCIELMKTFLQEYPSDFPGQEILRSAVHYEQYGVPDHWDQTLHKR